jgi:hypothetical protein
MRFLSAKILLHKVCFEKLDFAVARNMKDYREATGYLKSLKARTWTRIEYWEMLIKKSQNVGRENPEIVLRKL